MSSQFSIDRMTFCQHNTYQSGCPSCFLYETGVEILLAQSEIQRCSASIKIYEVGVKEAETREDGRDDAQNEYYRKKRLNSLLKEHADWKSRCEALEEVFAVQHEEVKELCREAESAGLTRAAIFDIKVDKESNLESMFHPATICPFEPFCLDNKCPYPHSKNKNISDDDAMPDFLVNIAAGLDLSPKSTGNTEVVPKKASDDHDEQRNEIEEDRHTEAVESANQSIATLLQQRLSLRRSDPERQARVDDIEARIRAWSPPKDVDDRRKKFSNPTKFYRGPCIDIEDHKKVGLTWSPNKPT